ncbi:MAG: hypothetical protein JWO50_887 [Candidatus Kaiserbacteria bacterium]|nr:hypothetical protein [Candidatus Kaiserbacteria bacterium]
MVPLAEPVEEPDPDPEVVLLVVSLVEPVPLAPTPDLELEEEIPEARVCRRPVVPAVVPFIPPLAPTDVSEVMPLPDEPLLPAPTLVFVDPLVVAVPADDPPTCENAGPATKSVAIAAA